METIFCSAFRLHHQSWTKLKDEGKIREKQQRQQQREEVNLNACYFQCLSFSSSQNFNCFASRAKKDGKILPVAIFSEDDELVSFCFLEKNNH